MNHFLSVKAGENVSLFRPLQNLSWQLWQIKCKCHFRAAPLWLKLKHYFLFRHFTVCPSVVDMKNEKWTNCWKPAERNFPVCISHIRYVSQVWSIPSLVNNEEKNKNHHRWRKTQNGHLLLALIRRSYQKVLAWFRAPCLRHYFHWT